MAGRRASVVTSKNASVVREFAEVGRPKAQDVALSGPRPDTTRLRPEESVRQSAPGGLT